MEPCLGGHTHFNLAARGKRLQDAGQPATGPERAIARALCAKASHIAHQTGFYDTVSVHAYRPGDCRDRALYQSLLCQRSHVEQCSWFREDKLCRIGSLATLSTVVCSLTRLEPAIALARFLCGAPWRLHMRRCTHKANQGTYLVYSGTPPSRLMVAELGVGDRWLHACICSYHPQYTPTASPTRLLEDHHQEGRSISERKPHGSGMSFNVSLLGIEANCAHCLSTISVIAQLRC